MSNLISTKLEALPEFLTTKDLMSLGLFRDLDAACIARKEGYSPDYIKVGRKILFPKSRVIEFLESRMQNGNIPKGTITQ